VAEESSAYQSQRGVEDSILSDGDGTLTGSTPRPPATKSLSARPQFANLGSPYEALRREMKNELTQGASGSGAAEDESDTELLFQQHTARLPDMSMTPKDRDFDDTDQFAQGTARTNKDPLMHRVLDKNYRLLATPHKGANTGVSPIRWKISEKKDDQQGKGKSKEKAHIPIWQDSPMSSPEMEVPKLRSAAFMSPMRAGYKSRMAAAAAGAPRTPGVSVQTPATARKTRDVYQETPGANRGTEEITWESDSDDDIYGGMSPPKTINFALPPSKLLQTPGKSIEKVIFSQFHFANTCHSSGS